MNGQDITVELERDPSLRSTRVWIVGGRPDGRVDIYRMREGHLTPETVERGVDPWECTLLIPDKMLQALVDGLTAKVPPTKREVVEAELEATKRHLADMRAMAFQTVAKNPQSLRMPDA